MPVALSGPAGGAAGAGRGSIPHLGPTFAPNVERLASPKGIGAERSDRLAHIGYDLGGPGQPRAAAT
jgi:hypothetical protein